MPELPEVETVRRGLQPFLEGAKIAHVEMRRPDLRFPLPRRMAERLAGRAIVSVGRRAKYLVVELEGELSMIWHLGMTGSFRVLREDAGDQPEASQPAPLRKERHDHLRIQLESARGEPLDLLYNDPRRFGFVMLAEGSADAHPMLSKLGVEPTGNTLSGQLIGALFRDRRTSLKHALLDQRLIAGLGNIYAAEALWRAGLSPLRAAGSIALPGRKWSGRRDELADSIRNVIADAIASGGSSLRDFMRADGSLGYFQHSFGVYDREGGSCRKPGCAGTISRIVQSGRATFYCPICQR